MVVTKVTEKLLGATLSRVAELVPGAKSWPWPWVWRVALMTLEPHVWCVGPGRLSASAVCSAVWGTPASPPKGFLPVP